MLSSLVRRGVNFKLSHRCSVVCSCSHCVTPFTLDRCGNYFTHSRNWDNLLSQVDLFLDARVQPIIMAITDAERSHHGRNKEALIMLGKLPCDSEANSPEYRQTMLHASAQELLEPLGRVNALSDFVS